MTEPVKMHQIIDSFVDPNRRIYGLNDPQKVFYDLINDRIVRPIGNNKTLLAITLLKDCLPRTPPMTF